MSGGRGWGEQTPDNLEAWEAVTRPLPLATASTTDSQTDLHAATAANAADQTQAALNGTPSDEHTDKANLAALTEVVEGWDAFTQLAGSLVEPLDAATEKRLVEAVLACHAPSSAGEQRQVGVPNEELTELDDLERFAQACRDEEMTGAWGRDVLLSEVPRSTHSFGWIGLAVSAATVVAAFVLGVMLSGSATPMMGTTGPTLLVNTTPQPMTTVHNKANDTKATASIQDKPTVTQAGPAERMMPEQNAAPIREAVPPLTDEEWLAVNEWNDEVDNQLAEAAWESHWLETGWQADKDADLTYVYNSLNSLQETWANEAF